MSLIDIRNHHSEDHARSVKFGERAAVVNKMISMLGYKRVKDGCKVDKDTFIENW